MPAPPLVAQLSPREGRGQAGAAVLTPASASGQILLAVSAVRLEGEEQAAQVSGL